MTTQNNINNQNATQELNQENQLLGESRQEIKHEITLFAEPVFHIGGFTVTNSLINSWLVIFFNGCPTY